MIIKRAIFYAIKKAVRTLKILLLKCRIIPYTDICRLEKINHKVTVAESEDFRLAIFEREVDYTSINWHKDYESGYVYPNKRFDRINYTKQFNKGIDVKFPWELSRFQFGVDLALYYKNGKDEKYYLIFKSLVKNWIECNPFLIGINWVCTMDIAIRAANWIVAANLFGDIFWNDEDFVNEISKSLIKHALYIETFPEIRKDGSNNHLISDYSGLYILALSLISYPRSGKWQEMAKSGLEQGMWEQVLEDGTNFENSIPYHRLVVELFAIPLILNESDFSYSYKERLFRMFEFVGAYIDHSGNAPQIGDNDSGVFIRLSNDEEQNHAYLLSLGKSIFGYDFCELKQTGYIPVFKNANINFNYKNIRNYRESLCFEKSGYYFLKNENMILSVFCPTTSKGHRHFDTGSFTLSYKGNQIIVDPGTGCYTSDLKIRKLFRDYPSHNIYFIDQQNSANNNYFRINVTTKARIKTFTKDTLSYCIDLENGIRVVRNFKLFSDELQIDDIIEGDIDDLNTALHFFNDAECIIEGAKQVNKVEYLYSPTYLVMETKNKIVINPGKEVKIRIICK